MPISIDLIGQTGNQQFQIATVLTLALDNKDSWVIPEHSLNKAEWPLHYKLLPTMSFAKHRALPTTYREPTFAYSPIPYKPGMKLHGYFQSEKYFAHRRPEVLALFKREWKKFDPMMDTVAVHVRRGDYLKYPTKHPTPSVEWLKRAMSYFSDLQFLFFSDDIQWCKNNFPGHRYSEGRSTLDDMSLMSACAHHIISASTFSWWGSWMCENPNQIVIAPKVWFGPGNAHLDYKDIVPDRWIKI